MTVGLETVTSYLPEEVVQASYFNYLAPVTPANVSNPDEIRRLRDPHAAEIMAETVARKALDAAGLSPSDIDLILTQNIGGRLVMPGLGTHVHHALGFPRHVPAWNLQTSCASFVDGCELARNMVLAGNYRRVLLVTVTALHTGGWGVDHSTPFSAGTGDGAGACIVSGQNVEFQILSYANQTFGEVYADCAVDSSPLENPELLEGRSEVRNACGLHMTEKFYDWITHTAGKSFALDVITPALRRAGLSLKDLNFVIPHQVMKDMADSWIEGLVAGGMTREKWRDTWRKYGNIGAVDVAATLSELRDSGALPRGAVIAFFAPGAGGHTPAMIVRWLGSRGEPS